MTTSSAAKPYSPIYFLGSLGSGGLTVSFFIYFMFMIDHPKTPLATFDFIFPAIQSSTPIISGLIILNLIIILLFAFLHLKLLIWNIHQYKQFKKTEAYQQMKGTAKEVTLMAIPLTYAMTVNAMFVLGAVFVPKLWTIVEYLFPGAILAFLVIGVYALKLFMDYFTRMITTGDFDFVENNSLSQMIAVFAFAMIGVGLAAPGAMSHIKAVSATGMFFSIFFFTIAMMLAGLKMLLGFKSMLTKGISKDASVSLWIVIPILTLFGITLVRQAHGFSHNFNAPLYSANLFFTASVILSLQILFGIIGYIVMKRIGYFDDVLNGDETIPSAYSLVCPGVAIFVFGMFFIYFGLVQNGIVERFSIPYFIVLAPLVFIQYKTVRTLFKLKGKLQY